MSKIGIASASNTALIDLFSLRRNVHYFKIFYSNKPGAIHWGEGEEGAYARGHEDGKDKVIIAVREALKSAGLKVKGDNDGKKKLPAA